VLVGGTVSMVTFLLQTWREKHLSFMVAACLPFHSIDVHISKNFHLFTFVHRAKVFYYVICYTKGTIMSQLYLILWMRSL